MVIYVHVPSVSSEMLAFKSAVERSAVESNSTLILRCVVLRARASKVAQREELSSMAQPAAHARVGQLRLAHMHLMMHAFNPS